MAKAADEMSHYPEYDYVIINHDLARSVAAVQTILDAERLRIDRQQGLGDFVKQLRQSSSG
jgi:guanylate kinase